MKGFYCAQRSYIKIFVRDERRAIISGAPMMHIGCRGHCERAGCLESLREVVDLPHPVSNHVTHVGNYTCSLLCAPKQDFMRRKWTRSFPQIWQLCS